MRSKKKFVLMLSLLLVIFTVITGCSGTENASETKGNKKQDDGKLKTLTYFVGLNGNAGATMKTYNGIAAYQKLEEMTGVHVEFQHPPSGDEGTQQFNLMMASGDLPDVIEWYWNSVPGGATKYLKSGQIIKLNKYIEKYAPNLSGILEEHPEWKKQITTDKGAIYGFPFFRGGPKLLTFYGPIIRKDWLDKLGLEIPSTLDEWHTVLKAFKTQDPNGNGKADEIPLLPTSPWGTAFSNAFIGAWGITPGFYQVDGKVKYGPTQPEFKEFLALMKQWYDEGLIDSNYVATDHKLRTAKITSNRAGAFIGYLGSSMGHFIGLMKEENPGFQLAGTPYATLKEGQTPIVSQQSPYYNGVAAAITKDNEHVVETVKWLDKAYGKKGHMLMNFGVKGESYKMVDGYPKYTKLITDNPEGLPMAEALAKYTRVSWNGPFVQDPRYIEQYMQYPSQNKAIKRWMHAKNEILLPPITVTPEESEKLSSIMTDVNTFRETMVSKFIMGDEPLSKFDEYLQTLKGMGIEQAVKIKQAALDRYKQR